MFILVSNQPFDADIKAYFRANFALQIHTR